MGLLSPSKVLMILVIALIVLGPDKLPSTARRMGALWSDVKRWRSHLETEVRATFPDLPSTTEIARAVRSPLSVLDRLADEHAAASGGGPAGGSTTEPVTDGSATSPGPRLDDLPEPDIASMN